MKNYGFVPSKKRKTDYELGSGHLEDVVLQEDGQWTYRLPKSEHQKKYGVDTNACVAYGICNNTEILVDRKFKVKENYSDRYLSITAKNRPMGNTPTDVCDAVRKYGMVDEEVLPFTKVKSWEEYMNTSILTERVLDKGAEWLGEYELKYEWVFNHDFMPHPLYRLLIAILVMFGRDPREADTAMLKQALKYSPVGASVRAWKKRNGLYYKNIGERDNHWITIVGYKDGDYWLIFDNYDEHVKKLEWYYPFGQAQRYSLEKKK